MSSRFYFCCAISLPRQVCPLLGLRHRCQKRLLLKPTSESRVSQQKLTMLDWHPNTQKNYAIYSPEDCSKVGQYAAEHGLTKASQHFTVPESTARLLKKQYLSELNHGRKNGGEILEAVGYVHAQFFCYSHLM